VAGEGGAAKRGAARGAARGSAKEGGEVEEDRDPGEIAVYRSE
jgi:hypothetical protein